MKATAVPARDVTLNLADGRAMAWAEWGDLDGRPVILLHGAPGSRLLCPDLDATVAAGVKLITIDRPGYGRSDPNPSPSRLGWVDDLVALMDHIGLPPCPVVGWSAGGPYALASGFRAPERVSVVGLAASIALADDDRGDPALYSADARVSLELHRRDRAAGIEAETRASKWYDSDGWHAPFTESWGEADDRLRTRPDTLAALEQWMREGARQGPAGLIADGIAWTGPDGFSAADVRRPVVVWIADADIAVERRHADLLVATLPDATLVSFAGGGHLFPIDHWAEMLARIV